MGLKNNELDAGYEELKFEEVQEEVKNAVRTEAEKLLLASECELTTQEILNVFILRAKDKYIKDYESANGKFDSDMKEKGLVLKLYIKSLEELKNVGDEQIIEFLHLDTTLVKMSEKREQNVFVSDYVKALKLFNTYEGKEEVEDFVTVCKKNNISYKNISLIIANISDIFGSCSYEDKLSVVRNLTYTFTRPDKYINHPELFIQNIKSIFNTLKEKNDNVNVKLRDFTDELYSLRNPIR